jgi:hypothetical protein
MGTEEGVEKLEVLLCAPRVGAVFVEEYRSDAVTKNVAMFSGVGMRLRATSKTLSEKYNSCIVIEIFSEITSMQISTSVSSQSKHFA